MILFRIGLSICKLLETDILHSEDIGTLFMLLKKPFDGECNEELIETLLAAAFDKSWLGSIPRAALDHFRAEHIVTLREYDQEVLADKEAMRSSEDEAAKRKQAKKRSGSIYNGVERSLANVLQTVKQKYFVM